MNTELLERVRIKILEEPRHHDMESWVHTYRASNGECNSTACIGGWCLALNLGITLYKIHDESILNVNPVPTLAEIIGTSLDQAMGLLYAEQWPWSYYHAYWKCRDKCDWVGAAEVTAARLRLFIDSNGTDVIPVEGAHEEPVYELVNA